MKLIPPGRRLDGWFVSCSGRAELPPSGSHIVLNEGLDRRGSPSIAVAIATFGDQRWIEQGRRAEESVRRQSNAPDQLLWIHSNSLHSARNACVALARTSFIVFLDADDELDEGFIVAMRRTLDAGGADIAYPSVSVNGSEAKLNLPRDLRVANHIHISSGVRVDSVRAVGGFRRLPVLEDWDLWLRLWMSGSKFEPCADAVLVVHTGDQGRNKQSNELARWQLRRSWSRLPVPFGGLRPDPPLTILFAVLRRRAARKMR